MKTSDPGQWIIAEPEPPGFFSQYFGSDFFSGMRIRFWQKKMIRRAVPQKKGDILKFYGMNILDNFKGLLFCCHTFGVRRPL